MLYRYYCRAAAVLFAVFTMYPLTTKLLEHRLAHDWAHTALHLVSCLLAVYAGWLAPDLVAARLFASVIGIGYGVLGAVGWFIPGLLLSTPFAIPLDVVDNVFHLVLAGPALVVMLIGPVTSRREHRLVGAGGGP